MFSIHFYTASLLKDIADSFSALYEQFHLRVIPDSLQFKALDATRITILEGQLLKKGFEHFECSGEVNLTVRFDNLNKVLGLAKKEDKLIIQGEGTFDKLSIQFFDKDNKSEGKFFLNLKDDSRIEYEPLGSIVFRHTMEMPSKTLQKIIYDLFNLDEDIVIRLDEGKAIFELGNQFWSESQQKGEMITANIIISDNSSEAASSRIAIKSPGGITQKFSAEYLKALCKPCFYFDRVKCYMSEEAPMLIEYYVKNTGTIKIYIAPKLI